MTATAAPPVRVAIERSEPGARREFEVPRAGARVVLDLIAAAGREDPSLFYRFSCRSGFCGTCTVQLDGAPVLACRTPVPDAATVHLAPLGGLPVVRDLVVDTTPFTERWEAIGPTIGVVGAEGVAGDLAADGADDADDADDADAANDAGDAGLPRPLQTTYAAAMVDSLDCISCGACFAACDLSSADSTFLGPAALTRAMVTVADARDRDRGRRLALVSGHAGVEGCHGIGACSLACPQGLEPARAIRRLRRWRVRGLP